MGENYIPMKSKTLVHIMSFLGIKNRPCFCFYLKKIKVPANIVELLAMS
jgi:hypothetical protein